MLFAVPVCLDAISAMLQPEAEPVEGEGVSAAALK